ncbi:MAG: hypothetical protein U0163_05955 [Gemmatimonadaceae bacterium]
MTRPDPAGPRIPTRAERAIIACLLGVLAALLVRSHGLSQPSFTSDFDQILAAGRALLSGTDPYTVVGPGRAFEWKWPLYYPLPAILLTLPLALLPVLVARMLFAGISTALFTWAITRDGWSRWPIFVSVTLYVSVDLVQWSSLLSAAFFLPALAVVGLGKPNFGLALAAGDRGGRWLWWLLVGAIVLLAASFIVQPSWLAAWYRAVRSAPHFVAPVRRPFGFVLLLAALRWRRPEGRWLLALSLVPQAPTFYDQLLLTAVCAAWWEAAILSASTYVLFFYVGNAGAQPDYAAWGRLVGNATVWFCYVPCLLMLLRRPNEGALPAVPLLRRARRAP